MLKPENPKKPKKLTPRLTRQMEGSRLRRQGDLADPRPWSCLV